MINKSNSTSLKSFLTVLMLSFCVFAVQSQSLEWAVNFETNNNEATAIVCDEVGNVYSAFNDITGNSAVSYRTGEVQLISQNPQGDINWEVQFAGSGRIFDMVVAQDKIYVLGLVKDSLQIATEWIYSFENQQYIAFILCINATGDIQWVTSTPWNENTMLVNIELDNETFYTVGLFNDVNSRLDSWDLDGNLIQSKLIEELRTLSDIEFDSMHNIYLSGTGDPNGVIDTVAYTNSTPPSS